MAKRLIHVGQDDDISDLAGKLQAADPGDQVALIVPAGAQAFQTALNVRLLRSVAMKRGLSATIVSPDPRIQEAAQRAGLIAYSSVAALEGGIPVVAPRPGFRPVGPSPGPRAPFLPDRPAAAVPGVASVPAAPPFEYVPRPISPAETAGAELPASSPAAGSVPLAADVPGAVPPPRTGPWGAPIVPPWPPAPLDHALPAAQPRAPFLPASPGGVPARPGSRWTALSDIPDDGDGPVSPWTGTGSAFAAGATAGMIGAPPAPSAPPAVTAPPPSGTGLSSHRPPPTPPRASTAGRLRLPSRRVIYGAVVGLLALGVILFLLLGTSATVTITVAEQPLTVNPTIQGTTSTAQASQSNYILSKQITDTASQTFQASPTGTQTVPGVAATGQIQFTVPASAGGCVPGNDLTVYPGSLFETSGSTPVVFSLTGQAQAICAASGSTSFPPVNVTASSAGTSGNVPPGAIDTCPAIEPWCQSWQITNVAPTTGGVNASTEAVASSADITNWQEQLGQVENQLGQKAASDLIAKAGQEKVAIDPNGGGRSITYVVTPSTFPPATAGTVMTATTVTVTMTAQETLYNPADLNAVVLKDLQASANLPAGDSLVPSQLHLNNLQIIQAGSDGSFALSVSGVDYYHGKVDLSQLGSQLSGRSPGSVQGIVQQAIPNVQSVTVDETPIQFLFMPFSSSSIHIVETFVTSSGSGSSASG